MPSIRLTGDIAHIMEGTRAQAADLNLTLAEDGFPVAVTIRKGPLEVLTEAESGAIFCGSRVEFFRGLTMLAARFDERPFRVRETPSLDLLGAMLDCSRNAVPTMAAAKTFLRRLSRMGYNAVLLYTEDTYEVAGRPYFGYLRGRFSQAELALPGGCPLGDRPIDLHVKALSQLGVRFCFEEGRMRAVWHKRLDGDIRLPLPSVGATENLLLACALGKRTVNITGAAREPEIADLIGFLRAAGADISGAGTSSLQICGVSRLHGATYTILPDRIETATYLCMAAGCGGETELLRCDARLLLPVIERLREAGCEISADADRIVLRSSGRLLPLLPVSTAPYPGFPTDAQALLMAAVLKAAGGSEFRETIFERRFLHVPELRKLGADIQVAGSTARVRGVRQLHGAKLRAEDLRGAAALLTASMMAEGESELTGLCHLLRGYEKPEQNLKNLGASIKSVDIPAPFVYNT